MGPQYRHTQIGWVILGVVAAILAFVWSCRAFDVDLAFVELGAPKHEIVRVAKEQGVDLVVVGSYGRHGLQLLLGSTANGVLHLAACDVLAVRV